MVKHPGNKTHSDCGVGRWKFSDGHSRLSGMSRSPISLILKDKNKATENVNGFAPLKAMKPKKFVKDLRHGEISRDQTEDEAQKNIPEHYDNHGQKKNFCCHVARKGKT